VTGPTSGTTPQAPDPHDAATDDLDRDDAGRTDESPGFDTQAQMFTFLGVFLTVLSLVYGFWTKEAAGATLLALASGLSFTTGGYLGWRKPPPGADVGQTQHDDVEPWFPDASIWPFAIGAALALVGNGLLLGTWLLIPAAMFLLYTLIGFVVQTRRRA
jgi:hypothetical protein